jgi:hypothetical protein
MSRLNAPSGRLNNFEVSINLIFVLLIKINNNCPSNYMGLEHVYPINIRMFQSFLNNSSKEDTGFIKHLSMVF